MRLITNTEPVVTHYRKVIGETLAEIRESVGWTVSQLAERLEMAPERWQAVEDGFEDLPVGYLWVMGEVLEISLGQLWRRVDEAFEAAPPSAELRLVGTDLQQ